jgi:tripartite-type tricarboxylate transporter receptor subunit TctC
MLAVRADSPWKTSAAVRRRCKANGARHQLWLVGPSAHASVPMEILSQNASVKMTHVRFTGAGPAVVALGG